MCPSTGPVCGFSRIPCENSPPHRVPTATRAFSQPSLLHFCPWEHVPHTLLAPPVPETHPAGSLEEWLGSRWVPQHPAGPLSNTRPCLAAVERVVGPRSPCVLAPPSASEPPAASWLEAGTHFCGYQATYMFVFKFDFSVTVYTPYHCVLVSGGRHSEWCL